jgi:hypothetical protein
MPFGSSKAFFGNLSALKANMVQLGKSTHLEATAVAGGL